MDVTGLPIGRRRYCVRAEQLAVARDMWKVGISADVFYGAHTASLQEQIDFAQGRGVKFVVVIRERDLQAAFPEDVEHAPEHADYNVSLRVLAGVKGKQAKERFMPRSELVENIGHS
jgi:histidyl-tRNA synthetase